MPPYGVNVPGVNLFGGPAPTHSAPGQYTPMATHLGAGTIVRGTVLLSLQGLQYYQLSTDFGAVWAMYNGGSRGRIGAMESAGFVAGQEVWVCVSESLPNLNSFIIGAASQPIAGAYHQASGLLVYPQVAGFELFLEGTSAAPQPKGERWTGQAYLKGPKLRNYNSGVTDTTDGDWVMHNRFGAAVGVETFRAYLQGGPMTGVYCYSEDGELRLVGAQFTQITTGTEYEDRPMGPAIIETGRRVYYPMDAVYENVPQKIWVSGPQYGGEQTFYSYREKDNLDGQPGETNRQALLHEYRGFDGTYILSSAASITLQKTVNIRVPIEILEPTNAPPTPAPCNDEDPEYDYFQKPYDPGTTHATVVENLRVVQRPELRSPISTAMQARELAARFIDWQARGGFDQLPQQWTQGAKPEKVFGVTGDAAKNLFTGDPGMWKCVARSFELNLGPYGAKKRYYMGTALMNIGEDGSIVLQDAWGSQIMMSGGNIYLSANHDVVTVAGRNRVDVAGRDTSIRTGRHFDVLASEGHATLVASASFTLVGGADGHGGVLIESRGDTADVNDGGENPGQSGAVILRANQLTALESPQIRLQARKDGWNGRSNGGQIMLDAGDVINWRTKNDENYGYIGAEFYGRFSEADVVLGPTSYFKNAQFMGDLHYTWLRFHGDSTGIQRGITDDALAFRQEATADYFTHFTDYATDPLVPDRLEAKFLTSKQYNIPGVFYGPASFFAIPEPEWQIRARADRDPSSVLLNTAMIDLSLDGTAPMPGSEAWARAVALVSVTQANYGQVQTVDDNPAVPADANTYLMRGI